MQPQNLFENIPQVSPEELFTELLHTKALKLERIVSYGQATPPGQWYDQEQSEWVLLLKGAAGLRFGDRPEIVELLPGDYLLITPHQKHRVEWTKTPTIWLALHF